MRVVHGTSDNARISEPELRRTQRVNAGDASCNFLVQGLLGKGEDMSKAKQDFWCRPLSTLGWWKKNEGDRW